MVTVETGTFGSGIGDMLNDINILGQGSDLIVLAIILSFSLFFGKNGKIIDVILAFVGLSGLSVVLGLLDNNLIVLYGVLAIALWSVFNFMNGSVFSKKDVSSAFKANKSYLGGSS